MDKSELRIVYMGTPYFAVAPLKKLIEKNYNIVGVVTNPDKPAGRGQKIKESSVKIFARENNLPILQPEKFKDEIFLQALKNLNADLQIVVAFKMLPKIVWSMPSKGTFNLHASLLPDYRGAAPINHAIINGEEKTGVTTFFLTHEIDTGNIILQKEVPIAENDTAGELHDRLMETGANLVVKTVDTILSDNYRLINQNKLITPKQTLKTAPKIFKNDCKINWADSATNIYNFIRGLSPYPTAWTEIQNNRQSIQLKIYESQKQLTSHHYSSGEIITDSKTFLKVACYDGLINILQLQQSGKKRLNIIEFLRGFPKINEWHCSTNHN
ncbi:MAG TPA: methionyl-tRNA formyltransferase [Bacteroidales bacterium]|nr:methionyl-tRNA formyltransferase [Bacteroidales bacterium]